MREDYRGGRVDRGHGMSWHVEGPQGVVTCKPWSLRRSCCSQLGSHGTPPQDASLNWPSQCFSLSANCQGETHKRHDTIRNKMLPYLTIRNVTMQYTLRCNAFWKEKGTVSYDRIRSKTKGYDIVRYYTL